MSPRRSVLFVSFFALLISTLSFAQAGKIESLPAMSDASVSDTVKKVLEPKGYRVILDDGSTACELWFRATVPAQAKKEVQGAIYPQFAESTLVAVIVVSQGTTDYRGEPIQAGAYTLRYALLPNDGAHLGVTPNRDFLLLIPAASDADPDTVYKIPELMAQSRRATGVQHPGPLSLVAADHAEPAVSKDEEEHYIFSTGIKLSTGETLPLALIVKGVVAQ